jgi:N-acetylglutamate synthase-like GNAT family acetyltransferase
LESQAGDRWQSTSGNPQDVTARNNQMIRQCRSDEFGLIGEIINDAAQAYRGVIPEDRWHEPYMSPAELEEQVKQGVIFWGTEQDGILTGVMGIQPVQDVTLIRHAYVRTACRNRGVGSSLLRHLRTLTDRPILIGTWAAAVWAVAFYEKHGFRKVTPAEKDRLLKKYWSIPDRQVETSVVLADERWFGAVRAKVP